MFRRRLLYCPAPLFHCVPRRYQARDRHETTAGAAASHSPPTRPIAQPPSRHHRLSGAVGSQESISAAVSSPDAGRRSRVPGGLTGDLERAAALLDRAAATAASIQRGGSPGYGRSEGHLAAKAWYRRAVGATKRYGTRNAPYRRERHLEYCTLGTLPLPQSSARCRTIWSTRRRPSSSPTTTAARTRLSASVKCNCWPHAHSLCRHIRHVPCLRTREGRHDRSHGRGT